MSQKKDLATNLTFVSIRFKTLLAHEITHRITTDDNCLLQNDQYCIFPVYARSEFIAKRLQYILIYENYLIYRNACFGIIFPHP